MAKRRTRTVKMIAYTGSKFRDELNSLLAGRKSMFVELARCGQDYMMLREIPFKNKL